ncbi:D-aminoacyl-tRNA deacylase [Vagococcus elongatus]|uniref:D-aminoacyl-tRNA deacylase n=1 Tax=Vagococcus elongatus TaxID=180344 RepID=A0A430AM18_9ENTE|nr:D-aminoacyl-tRNA deacylase [Vagococcus elongatus]RSU09135.1 D-tyrosyl-tRNA(Tyr) deacylase [Vagococcus elongatus]
MKVVIQRVTSASVSVAGEEISAIGKGLVVLLGVKQGDTQEEADYLVRKIINMRIFEDTEGKMNLNIQQVGGEILSISQFTLLANTKKGNRPSFTDAETPEKANELYEYFNEQIEHEGIKVGKGKFAAEMAVSLVNDGPVTIVLDTENK